ncbi:response regulator [Curvibacter sp. APW13]|uniref:response regulator n=1 Tax=Curvibacter sp. APW13 TaxID=3077236 RepID=UPI0028E084B7|nr:response regulator [Curvibacter sp. APW13]MDT8990701.1 response regulator [Curvibacter sp. APW13]
MRKYLNLRFGLPAGIFLVFLVLSVLSYAYNLRGGEKHTLDTAISDALSQSERLARTAQTELTRNKAQLDSDLGVESTDLRIAALAVVADDGAIQATHRLDWTGKNIVQMVPGFDLQRLKTVTSGRLPDVQVLDGSPRRLRVLSPFVEAGTKSQIRSLVSGAVFLEYNLALEDAQSRWDAQKRWMAEAAFALLTAGLLSLILYRRVARPLLRIEGASMRLSENPEAGVSVPVSGPFELRQLAMAFNAMAEKVVTARRDIAWESAKLQAIVGSAMDAIITVDRRQRVTMINEAALELFGYTKEQAIGLPLETFLPERFRATHAAKVEKFGHERVLHRGMGQRGTFWALRSNGQEFPIRASISHLQVNGEELFTAILQDVTKEVEAEDAIRQLTTNLEQLVEQRTAKLTEVTRSLELQQQELSAARDDLQTIFDAAAVGIVLAKDRVLIRCNSKAVTMLGYASADELHGQSARIMYPSDEEFVRQGEAMYGQLSRTGNSFTEHPMVRKDGSSFWVSVNARLLTDGPMRGVTIAFLEDVSLKHAASDALEQAKAAAEAATRSKSDFLANMSHEIRTPMNAIIGMSHLALKTNLDKKQRSYIEKVHRSAESLLGIINDILDFSKIEAGKMNLESVDFNLDDVMDNLANLVGIKTEEKGLELLFNMSPDLPTSLVGDPLRLGQVLINLGNNAAKFTEQGEIIIGIDKVPDTGEGVLLHFWVRDSGIGMTHEQCARLFQSFSQADASTTRKYGGTGLGLAISKSLVEAMHGRIWVESVAGQGSTFHFEARFGVQASPQVRRMLRAEELAGVRALVVDDNAAARTILCDMVQAFGLHVDSTADAPSGLQMLSQADHEGLPYELVLMDWKMPGMDGVEAMRQLRGQQFRQMPAIVMVTSYGREEAMISAGERGVPLQIIVTKPVTPSNLLEAIGEALGRGMDVITHSEVRAEDFAGAVEMLKGARMLLVEDNDMNQELAVELLTSAGIEVVVAHHGQEALDILARDTAFDGVLMDCQMPVMDGYNATREIRKNPALQKLPIIAMTANAMAGDKEKVLEAGMWDHIAKPLNVEVMFNTIAKWMHPAGTTHLASTAIKSVADDATGTVADDLFYQLSSAGVDVRFGLKTALNKKALYLRMLRKFRDGQHDFSAKFARARQDTDAAAAQRCAHTLRGTAGTIGAKPLQEAAEQLELACTQAASGGQVDELLQKVLRALEPVMRALQALPDEGESTCEQPAVSVDAEQVAAVRARLMALLERGDSTAMDLCEQHADLLSAAYPTHWKKIIGSLNAFDFEAALALIQAST